MYGCEIVWPEPIGSAAAGEAHEKAVEPLEVAVDAFVADDALDGIDRGRVAFRGQARVLLAMDPDDLLPAAIDRVHEVRGGAKALAGGRLGLVEHDDAVAFAGQQIGSGEPRHAGADDADGRLEVAERSIREIMAERTIG